MAIMAPWPPKGSILWFNSCQLRLTPFQKECNTHRVSCVANEDYAIVDPSREWFADKERPKFDIFSKSISLISFDCTEFSTGSVSKKTDSRIRWMSFSK